VRQTSFTLTVTNVYADGAEQGLLGIAFSPNRVNDRWCYFYHTQNSLRNNVVVRYRIMRDASGNYSVSSGEMVLPEIPTSGYHNGGHSVFDGSGNLMISTGDAETSSNAQSLTSLAGRVLRIRPNASSPRYIIPPGNPLGNDASRRREIWCWGLRNPWSIDQEMHTTRFYLGDVGASGDEEINDGSTFANFGWPTHEGPVASSSLQNYRNPVYSYPRSGSRASITGPVFYHFHGFNKFPVRFEGSAIFSDYARGWIRALLPNNSVETLIDTGLRYPQGSIGMAVWEGDVYFISTEGSPSPTLPPPTGPPDILRIGNSTDDAFDSQILSECATVGSPDAMLIKAQIHLESSFDPRAISDDTLCGIEPEWTSIESRSHGLFQMTPACGAQENDIGVNPAGHPKAGHPILVSSTSDPYWPQSLYNGNFNIHFGMYTMNLYTQNLKARFLGCNTKALLIDLSSSL
jgi:hypothetical protein